MIGFLIGCALAAEPSATLWYQAGEAGAIGQLSALIEDPDAAAGTGFTPLADGAQLDCTASDGIVRVSLTLQPPVDWAELPDRATCAVGDRAWQVQLDSGPPAGSQELAIRATLDGSDLNITPVDDRIASVQITLRVGDVAWAQPLESLVGASMRVPLAIPDEPPVDELELGVAHPLDVEILPIDVDGATGRTTGITATVRWSDRGPRVEGR